MASDTPGGAGVAAMLWEWLSSDSRRPQGDTSRPFEATPETDAADTAGVIPSSSSDPDWILIEDDDTSGDDGAAAGRSPRGDRPQAACGEEGGNDTPKKAPHQPPPAVALPAAPVPPPAAAETAPEEPPRTPSPPAKPQEAPAAASRAVSEPPHPTTPPRDPPAAAPATPEGLAPVPRTPFSRSPRRSWRRPANVMERESIGRAIRETPVVASPTPSDDGGAGSASASPTAIAPMAMTFPPASKGTPLSPLSADPGPSLGLSRTLPTKPVVATTCTPEALAPTPSPRRAWAVTEHVKTDVLGALENLSVVEPELPSEATGEPVFYFIPSAAKTRPATAAAAAAAAGSLTASNLTQQLRKSSSAKGDSGSASKTRQLPSSARRPASAPSARAAHGSSGAAWKRAAAVKHARRTSPPKTKTSPPQATPRSYMPATDMPGDDTGAREVARSPYEQDRVQFREWRKWQAAQKEAVSKDQVKPSPFSPDARPEDFRFVAHGPRFALVNNTPPPSAGKVLADSGIVWLQDVEEHFDVTPRGARR
eukprot:m.304056 g.304056  ORF g.304056 m.304056 type:complete len:538 (-) comp16502_c0_seq1:196-1809(-)